MTCYEGDKIFEGGGGCECQREIKTTRKKELGTVLDGQLSTVIVL
jgi:hypothetical protein